MKQLLILSIKPKYIEEILEGNKSIELRKSIPQKVDINDLILLYSTSPKKAVVGYGQINSFIQKTPIQMWESFSDKLGITEEEYFNYYQNSKLAIGIELKNIEQLEFHISLKEIKSKMPKFSPPQTYKYFSISSIVSIFKNELLKNNLKIA